MLVSTLLLLAASASFVSARCGSHDDNKVPASDWLLSLRNGTKVRPQGPFRKLRFEEGAAPLLLTDDEVIELLKTGRRFFDITDQDLEVVAKENKIAVDPDALKCESVATVRCIRCTETAMAVPVGPTKQAIVKPILLTLSQSNLVTYLSQLTAYYNRYYKSTYGAQASTAIFNRLNLVSAFPTAVTSRV